MAVPLDTIRPGAVFRFKTGLRRVTQIKPAGPESMPGFMVDWVYADDQPRRREGGSLWAETFRLQAIEIVPDHDQAVEQRQLLPSRRPVPCLPEPVDITLKTRCPGKWAMVDLETGELWGHDGKRFVRLTDEQAGEVAEVARMRMAAKGD